MAYPEILDEDATLDQALAGRSIARVGEGELRLAIGHSIKSQAANEALQQELRQVLLTGARETALICLPRTWKGMPAEKFWRQFEGGRYGGLYGPGPFGSAFISRPDMVNAIDRPDYWERACGLWKGRDVTLVGHGPKSLKTKGSRATRLVRCLPVSAYAEIDHLEEEIGRPAGPVLLAAGATATVLAARLARKGLWAIDVGHLGAFIMSAGAYSVERRELISEAYVQANRALHKRPEGFGGSGRKRAGEVSAFAAELGAEILLDYGCGQGTLKTALKAAGFAPDVLEYDPAMKGKDGLPKPADLVVCTDVLEHVEPEKLEAVLAHIRRLARIGAFLLIATRPAKKILDDGRNAHLIVEPGAWWRERIEAAGFTIERSEDREGHEVRFWCRII